MTTQSGSCTVIVPFLEDVPHSGVFLIIHATLSRCLSPSTNRVTRSAWCPQPTKDLMRGFPQSMLDTAAAPEFWEKAKKLLHVTPAGKINDSVFGKLQDYIDTILEKNLKDIPSASYSESGPLAVGKTTPTSSLSFIKFSTPGPLLTLQDHQRKLANQLPDPRGRPLMIATNVVVQNFLTDPDNDDTVNVLKTSKGDLCFPNGKTNVILATGAIPATTILLNSLGSMQKRAGSRLTGHFLTHIAARFPIDSKKFPDHGKCEKGSECTGDCQKKLEIAATYVAGEDPSSGTRLQYHIQVTAIHSPHPEWDAVDAGRECPDYAAAATLDQLRGSENHIVISML